MKRLATGAIVVALIGTPALAADIATPATSYYPKFLPPAIYDWTGIYVGGHIGGGVLTDSVSQNGVSPAGFDLGGSGSLRPAGVIGARNWRSVNGRHLS
jgi:outer membrane immunogenic protein